MQKPIIEGPRYKGFSSVETSTNPNRSSTETYDISLVKQDLLNHFNIRYREIPGRPGFGSKIYNMMAEPFDTITETMVRREVERVIRYDPRVSVMGLSVDIDRDNHSMQVSVILRYIELGTDEVINFSVTEN